MIDTQCGAGGRSRLACMIETIVNACYMQPIAKWTNRLMGRVSCRAFFAQRAVNNCAELGAMTVETEE
jgi:hypothetical protein